MNKPCIFPGFTALMLSIAIFQAPSVLAAGTVEQRLQALEDREAVRELLLDYGRTLDRRDFAAFANLFAADGEWIGGMGGRKGPAAIQQMMEETIGRNTAGMSSPNLHLFNNESIRIDGDTATAQTKWTFIVQGDDKRPQMVYIGHYDDQIVRVNGQWKFRKRVAYGDVPAADPLANAAAASDASR